ncbi:RGG repeats nuclear RNA binding protein A-like [Typha angustifolia]|uniref:RGG repeats nuclear RNA binding protein A-like n=1 Tax=Typha angustifolia TaxID=59011 RepID=UPI003C2C376D
MATANPFDLLGDDENDDPSQLIAAQQQKIAAKKPAAPVTAPPPATAKLPSKPAPPSQAVRDARAGRGGPARGRGGRGGGVGQRSGFGNGNVNEFSGYHGSGGEEGAVSGPPERERVPRQPFRGGRRGGYGNEGGGEFERPPRRTYERRSGTGQSFEMKREGSGRGNWGTATDETLVQEAEDSVNNGEKIIVTEKKTEQEGVPSPEASKDSKEDAVNEAGEKEQEDKEMTLEEYEKLREEKRKALLALKAEERKVEIDKELQSMQQLSMKKGNDDVFIKLGSDKDSLKKKENAERDERAKKSLSINEFLKPAEGETHYSRGRGRGRGRSDRGGPFSGGFGGVARSSVSAPSIEDQNQFPILGGK